MTAIFFKLLVGHALADYPLQGDFIGKFKSWQVASPIPETIWPWLLSAHALIHGGFVYAITGHLWMGIAETLIHWMIDFAKCSGWTNFHADQTLHVICKVAWTLLP